MAKVSFKRIQDSADIDDVPMLDGQLIYTKDGKTYMDYEGERIATGQGGGGEPKNEYSTSTIDAYSCNYVNETIKNTYSEDNKSTYSCNYINKANDYSNNETVIGKWVNDKPIYRQVYAGNNLTLNSNSWTETPVSIPGGSFIIEVKIINDENGQVMPLCGYTTSNNKLNVLNLRSGNVSYSLGYSLIVEYTKSTD